MLKLTEMMHCCRSQASPAAVAPEMQSSIVERRLRRLLDEEKAGCQFDAPEKAKRRDQPQQRAKHRAGAAAQLEEALRKHRARRAGSAMPQTSPASSGAVAASRRSPEVSAGRSQHMGARRGHGNTQDSSVSGDHDSGAPAMSQGADVSTRRVRGRTIVITDSEPSPAMLTPVSAVGRDAGAYAGLSVCHCSSPFCPPSSVSSAP